MTVERSKSQRSFLTLTFIVNSVPKKLCLKIFVNFKYVSILIIMCFKHIKCSRFSSRERTGWLTMSTYLSLQPLLLFQKRLQMVQVSILIIMTNKRLECCFFLQRENKLTNHVHRSIFTASTPVPEKTTNSPSSRRSPNAGTKLPTQQNVIKTDDVPEETTGETNWFLLFLLLLIPVIGVFVVCRYWQKRRSRKPERKNSRSVEQTRPLMSRTPRKFLIYY